MNDFKESFLGFQYNGRHSSEFGIFRTIDNRMDMALRPESKDVALDVPGMDGQYYFGTNYTKRTFNINFAFFAMSESQLHEFKIWLNDKKIHDLIFDETPYKAYSAKVSGISTIKHLCFEESNNRVYRGEGTIQFVCNYPFARGLFRDLNKAKSSNVYNIIIATNDGPFNTISSTSNVIASNIYRLSDVLSEIHIDNFQEWQEASGLPENFDYINHGDLPMPFILKGDFNTNRIEITNYKNILINNDVEITSQDYPVAEYYIVESQRELLKNEQKLKVRIEFTNYASTPSNIIFHNTNASTWLGSISLSGVPRKKRVVLEGSLKWQINSSKEQNEKIQVFFWKEGNMPPDDKVIIHNIQLFDDNSQLITPNKIICDKGISDSSDNKFLIDSRNNQVFKINSDNKKIGILNNCITEGDFFYLNPGEKLYYNNNIMELEEFRYIYY